jgi:hypothetical protein
LIVYEPARTLAVYCPRELVFALRPPGEIVTAALEIFQAKYALSVRTPESVKVFGAAALSSSSVVSSLVAEESTASSDAVFAEPLRGAF